MEILHDLSKIDNANGEQIADYDTLKKVTELVTKHPELDGIFLDENGNLNVDDDKIKKAAEILVGKIINAANDSGQTGLAKLWSNRLEQLNKGDISMTDFWNGFGTDIEDANTKIDKFQSTFSAFRSALEEIQEPEVLKVKILFKSSVKLTSLSSISSYKMMEHIKSTQLVCVICM